MSRIPAEHRCDRELLAELVDGVGRLLARKHRRFAVSFLRVGKMSLRFGGGSHGHGLAVPVVVAKPEALLARLNAACLRVEVAVAVPGIVAIVVVPLHVRNALELGAAISAVSESDHLEKPVALLALVHPYLVAQALLGRRGLDCVEVSTEPQVLGHRLVEGVQHLIEVALALLGGGGR